MYRLHSVTALAVIVAATTGATSAQATVRVGGTVLIERDVAGSLAGQTWKSKAKGDDVYENEFIKTASESWAQIRFVDKTQIEIASTATIKIDRVVFNPNQSVRALMVGVGAGAVRWISGDSTPSAYKVNTPTASITVEGTVFDLFVEPQRTTVVLQSGRITVCSIGTPQRCQTLSGHGDMIVATPSNLEGPRPGPGPSDFEARCLSAAHQNCTIRASVSPPPQTPHSPGFRPTPGRRSAKSGTIELAGVPSGPPAVVHPTPPYSHYEVIPRRRIYYSRYLPRSPRAPTYIPGPSMGMGRVVGGAGHRTTPYTPGPSMGMGRAVGGAGYRTAMYRGPSMRRR